MKRLEKKFKRKVFDNKYFLAFDIPFEVKRVLNINNRVLNKEARNFRFVPMEQMHMTIKFLGTKLSQNSLDKIIEVVSRIQINEIDIQIDKLRFGFNTQVIPTILFYNIESLDLSNIYKQITLAINKLDLDDIPKLSFMKKQVYHITVARLKHQNNTSYGKKIREIINEFKFEPIKLKLDSFWLMESIKGKNTFEYKFLHKFNLR